MPSLRTFETHGWIQQGETESEAYGYCPFTSKDGKLYINKKTFAWHSKTLGKGGGASLFLELRSKQYAKELKDRPLKMLAKNRGLPPEAFTAVGMGWDGMFYTLPVRDERGHVTDVRRWRPGTRMLATSGCATGLWGMERLVTAAQNDPVYVCEGEWDGIALQWLLKQRPKKPIAGVVVAVPGANVFKQPWTSFFQGRTVHSIYDNDAAGEEGELLIRERLTGIAKKITYVHWMAKLPDKFDLRDWITNGAVQRRIPNRCWSSLKLLFRSRPRRKDDLDDSDEEEKEETKSRYDKPATLEQVYGVFNKWLLLKSNDFIKVALAAVISQEIPGDPVWLFLVGTPGSAKSEMCTAMTRDEAVFAASSLTPHSLISGSSAPRDPSLIPKLDGRVLVIKDFTSILALSEHDRSEIFGILRDAYDGYCSKVFGNGITREYQSRFTIVAGVTHKIHAMSSQNQALGERFLKYGMSDNLHHAMEDEIVLQAMSNVSVENSMRDELQDVVSSFLGGLRERVRASDQVVLKGDVALRMMHMAKFCARLRGVVERDDYRPDQMVSKPSAEIATRIGKQLSKMAMSLAMVAGEPEVGEEEYEIVRKIAIDTVAQRREDLVRCLWLECPSEDDALRSREVMLKTRYPLATVNRMLDDLASLDIARREGRSNAYVWSLTPYMRDVIQKSGVYANLSAYESRGDEIRRESRRRKVRLRRRLSKHPN